MSISLAVTLFALGIVGGYFSGWLGIGGGIIMAPLLLYVPSALGVGSFDMKVISGLTMVQSLFATGSGVLVHRKRQFVNKQLVLWMGGSIAAGSLAGALLSDRMSAGTLQGIFVVLAFIAAFMMFIPKKEPGVEPLARDVTFNRGLAAVMALGLGLVGGMVGQSGAFIVIPVMLYVIKIPTRTTIGSSLGIIFISALAGSIGKMATGQIYYAAALFCVSGALTGAQLGAMYSTRTRRIMLRRVLAIIIAATAVRMLFDLISG
jgi:hypothetical protein